jgi:membrane protease YdiL (CAAX protease family)
MAQLLANGELLFFSSAVAVASFGFLCYYYLSESSVVKNLLKTRTGETYNILFQRFLGAIIFGIIPLMIILCSGTKNISEFGIIAPVSGTYIWTIIISTIIITINYFNSQTPENLEIYPQIRTKDWSMGLLLLSALSWIVYLLSFEFLFRGFLFFASVRLIGLWPAIIVNTAIYSLVHLPKGFKETIGAIPFGILLCFVTFKTGSIWIAVVTHIVMALSNEWLSLKAHPRIFIKINRK